MRGEIPERTADSMRNFLKTQLKLGLEPYFKHNISNANVKYSHALPSIPKIR